MALKYFCDICQQEMKDMTENGEMKIAELGYDFTKKGKKAERVVNTTAYLFCGNCAKKVRDWAKNLRDSMENEQKTEN